MKRAFTILLVTVLAMLTVFAQGNTETSSSSVTTIQWWSPNWDEAVSREFIEEFEQENPDIKVELVVTDWDTYKAKVTAALTGKNAPELYSVLLTDVKPFAKLGLLAQVDELCAADGTDWSDMIQAALDIVSVDGKIYAMPFRYDGSGVLYNVDAIKSVGYDSFPTTWDDLTEMSKKLLEKGEYTPTAWPLGNQTNAVTRFAQQLYTYGGSFLSEDEKTVLLNTDEAKKALSAIVETIEEGYALKSSLEMDNTRLRDTFGSGKLAYYIGGPFDVDSLLSDYPEINLGTAVIPGIDSMGCTTANGWCVVMAENCKNKEAAAKLMEFIGRPENQARITASFPASYTALEDPQFSTEYLTPFAKQLDNSKEEPSYSRWAEMEPIIYQYIQEALNGNISVDEACELMNRDVTQLLGL